MTISYIKIPKKMYTDNDLNTRIEPKNQNISKVQVLIMILHEREQKKYSRGFC